MSVNISNDSNVQILQHLNTARVVFIHLVSVWVFK